VQGNIAEENHYYAYGLKIATLSSKKLGDSYEGTLKNNYLYNDKELFDDADLNWYDYGFRNYDPQIGRFPQLDPLTDSYPFLTPYQYASCDPITNIDVDGLEGQQAVGKVMSSIGKGITEAAENGGAVKQLTEVVIKASTAGSKVGTGVFLKVANIIAKTNAAGNLVNTSTRTKQAGIDEPRSWHGPIHPKLDNKPFGEGESYGGVPFRSKYGGNGKGRGDSNPDPQSEDISLIVENILLRKSQALDCFEKTMSIIKVGEETKRKIDELMELLRMAKGISEIMERTHLLEEAYYELVDGEKQEPIIKYQTKQGEWEYYEVDNNGKFKGSRYHEVVDPVQVRHGQNGDRDTIIKTTTTRPPLPKKPIKRKP
jgi:RHS repeat-associated protein